MKLFANLAEAAGEREVTLDVNEEATLAVVLDQLFEQYPSLQSLILDEDGTPGGDINFLRNGSALQESNVLAVEIDNEDELAIFPPVTGG